MPLAETNDMSAANRCLWDFTAEAIDGQPHDLARYRGQVVLIVNTASACGFTPQFAGLEALWQQHRTQGLVVLGFPCNQFGHQDPGANPEILGFCQREFGVSFPMMARVEVNGERALPLYQWLKSQAPGLLGIQAIKWNFTKFLIDRQGQVLRRYAPQTSPAALEQDVLAALAHPALPSSGTV